MIHTVLKRTCFQIYVFLNILTMSFKLIVYLLILTSSRSYIIFPRLYSVRRSSSIVSLSLAPIFPDLGIFCGRRLFPWFASMVLGQMPVPMKSLPLCWRSNRGLVGLDRTGAADVIQNKMVLYTNSFVNMFWRGCLLYPPWLFYLEYYLQRVNPYISWLVPRVRCVSQFPRELLALSAATNT